MGNNTKKEEDVVNHPKHYTNHPSGIECITITEHMNFCLGNALKYIWRADLKNGIQDLEKAKWYLEREIKRRTRVAGHGSKIKIKKTMQPGLKEEIRRTLADVK